MANCYVTVVLHKENIYTLRGGRYVRIIFYSFCKGAFTERKYLGYPRTKWLDNSDIAEHMALNLTEKHEFFFQTIIQKFSNCKIKNADENSDGLQNTDNVLLTISQKIELNSHCHSR